MYGDRRDACSSIKSSQADKTRRGWRQTVSTNDKTGYNFRFRGKFESAEQAYGIGSLPTQKAHSALRWLIERQGYQNGTQAIVGWAVSGKPIPKVVADSNEIRMRWAEDVGQDSADDIQSVASLPKYTGDAGQLFARSAVPIRWA